MAKLTCPSYLDDDAKKEWKRIKKLLIEEQKEIEDKDVKALESYCVCVSNIKYFSEQLKETGYLIFSDNGYPQQHPYYQMKRNSEQDMRSWMKELGLTPASRARMNKNNKVLVEGQTDEEMEEMISK